jgi:hypothetical protein
MQDHQDRVNKANDLPLTHMTEPALPCFPFPCSGIEAAESTTVISSGPRKTPRLSTPTTSPASCDLTRRRRPRGPLFHTGIAPEHRSLALFSELRPVCHSSSFGSCLMTAYPRRSHRSSPKPPPATICLLSRRAPSSRPASATSMVSCHLGETHHPLLARLMLCGPLLLVPATSSHLGHR